MARIKIGNFMGPQGPKGEQGPIGAVGPEGPQGPAGASGQVDFVDLNEEQISMITGPQGPEGPKGDNGNLSDFMVSIDDYGAIGDGVTDDSVAFNAMLSSDYTSFFIPDKTYFFNTELIIDRNNIKISGYGELLFGVTDGTGITVTGDNNTLSINVNGDDKLRAGITIEGANNVVDGCSVKNMYSESQMSWGITTNQNGKTIIKNNIIDTVNSLGNETFADSNGASRGVRVLGIDTNNGYTVIENNDISNIIGEEGDAIHLISTDFAEMEVTVKNNTINNFSRRGLKIQCSKTSVLNNTIETYDLYEGSVRCVDVQYSNDTLIDGNTFNIGNIAALGVTGSADSHAKNTTVTNNTIIMLSAELCIYTNYVDGLNFTNNIIVGGTGIAGSRLTNAVYKNNLFTELLTTDTDYPISILVDCNDVKIIDNTLEKSTTYGSMKISAENVAIIGNTFLNDSSTMEIRGGSGVILNNVVKATTTTTGDMTNHTAESNITIPTGVV